MRTSIAITVRVGKRVVPLDVRLSDTVGDVTRRLCTAEDLPQEFGTLLRANNDELDGWMTLEDCKVRSGDVLKFKQQLRITPRDEGSACSCSLPQVSRPCSSVSEGVSSLETTPMKTMSRRSSRLSSLTSLGSSNAMKTPRDAVLKVKTSTGRLLRVHVNVTDTMLTVMEKVRLHWAIVPGEQCIARIDECGLECLPQDATVDDCALANGAHVVLTKAPTPAQIYDVPETTSPTSASTTSAPLPPPTPHPHKMTPLARSDGYVRVKLTNGRVLKMKRHSYDTLVDDLVEAVEERLGAVMACGMLTSKNGSAYPGNLTLVQCGVLPGEIVHFRFPQPEPVHPKPSATPSPVPCEGRSGSKTASALSTVRFLRGQIADQQDAPVSPLCQFTLCSLEPIFGAPSPLLGMPGSALSSTGSEVRYE